jgi:hypothetical protein
MASADYGEVVECLTDANEEYFAHLTNDLILKKKTGGGPPKPKLIPGTERPHLNLLLSAKISKFVGIQAPELVKLAQWDDWESRMHRWVSSWRYDECFGMKGSQDKVVMVTNQLPRYSLLIRI